jgi:hypothetical protein
VNLLQHLSPGKKAEEAGIPPESMLALVYEGRAWKSKEGLNVPNAYFFDLPSGGGSTLNIQVVGDIGNSEAKFAALHRSSNLLVTRGTTTTFQTLSRAIYSTSDAAVWQQQYYDDTRAQVLKREHLEGAIKEIPPQYSDEFYSGNNAKENLVTGATDARFSQEEYILFLRTCICDILEAAGYFDENPLEEKNVGLCIGVRNEETVQGKGLKPEVKAALDSLLGPCVLIKTVGETRMVRKFNVREYQTLPQSYGAIYALDTNIMGRGHLVETDAITGWDGGSFDVHKIEGVRVGNGMRVSGERVANGGVFLARELAIELRKPENFPLVGEMTDSEAQLALRTETFKIGGKALRQNDAQRAAALIQDFKDSNGTKLIGNLASRHPRVDSLFLFYGGLFITLEDQVIKKMTDLSRPSDFYLILPYDDEIQLPKFANVIGLYGLFNLKNRKRAVR